MVFRNNLGAFLNQLENTDKREDFFTLSSEVSVPLLYAQSISPWSNQDSVMCLFSILNQ